MVSKQVDFNRFSLASKTEDTFSSEKALSVGVWFLVVILYLALGFTLYVIWQKANQG
jgi:hypothetical protein